ncbi:MAG TPA: hypothetical protein P5223_13550 [Phycisphaerae bacterium]|jgi:hypothetical protein|nr:hypothetical protein [Phycisphaerae bacterium]
MRKCVLIAALTIASIGGCPAPVSNDPARLEVNDTLREACYGHNDAQIRRWIAEVEQYRLQGWSKNDAIAGGAMVWCYWDWCYPCSQAIIDQVYDG